ncbi:chemotaxis protein CheA [Paenibacillus popilliae]|uniref:Chemotaxis protein CheA n=1 Tax=Paenibacillus popilliae ATCC 14706 TaxID=1212764 RepID=M9M2I2_PAEPP|nr:chemotaxis protein CheA [Paenibacillus popilliae]GAC43149.1 chemotaxis protein histidine kinase [Paenibacillus popilliae ATCC 14706]
MDLNQYLSMFIDEANDHLQALNENMLGLENNPEDIGIVQIIFRSAHTLKGMSATMGFEDLASLTHQMENVLDMIRNNQLKMDEFIFDTLFRSLDSLEAMVADITQGGEGKADVTQILAALKSIETGEYRTASSQEKEEAGDGMEASSETLDEFQRSILEQSLEVGMNAYHLHVRLQDDCVLKAVRAYMVFQVLGEHGEVVKSTPPVQDIEQDKFDSEFTIIFVSNTEQDELKRDIYQVSELESVTLVSMSAADIRAWNRNVEAVMKAGQETEAAAPEAAPASPVPAQAAPKPTAAKSPEAPRAGAGNGAKPVQSRTIRVDIERLDVLMNLLSEMLIDRVRLEQIAGGLKNTELTETVEHMVRVSSDLQNIVLKMRMVPVDTIFSRFPRMVRDLAKSLDKKIDFIITGAETELDRTVIDEIGDPLVHLLRNAVDHGIEPVAARLEKGKPETGTVHLRAYHSGNHVFIEIEEDGHGIDRDKVLNKAIKNGVIAQDKAASMSDEQVYQLLFSSGFSTAEKISDVSGRGVGLDVVKSKITALGGHVVVESQLGQGTKFIVQLPLTLSIMSAMLFRLGDEKYAIPLTSIVETGLITKDKIRRVHGGIRMVDYRDSVIPLLSLSALFDCEGYSDFNEDEVEIIIISNGDRLTALAVQEFIGQSEIVLKSLGNYMKNIPGISGATILGDGQVALIVDTNVLLK